MRCFCNYYLPVRRDFKGIKFPKGTKRILLQSRKMIYSLILMAIGSPKPTKGLEK
jgi:hypothetical protein